MTQISRKNPSQAFAHFLYYRKLKEDANKLINSTQIMPFDHSSPPLQPKVPILHYQNHLILCRLVSVAFEAIMLAFIYGMFLAN